MKASTESAFANCAQASNARKGLQALLAKRPKITKKELAKLVKDLELNEKQCRSSNKTDWTLLLVPNVPRLCENSLANERVVLIFV
jgi:hypothetical protein